MYYESQLEIDRCAPKSFKHFPFSFSPFPFSSFFITFANYLKIKMSKAIIKTEKGDMTVEFYDNDAPNTVANFKKLAKSNFYDNVIFHRVIPNFMIQGGDPTGTGAGGPGYKIDCELTGENQYHDRGVLSMAHAGRNTGGSQFFICHSRANTAHLDRNHTVFGKVIENVDVVDDIRQGDKILSIEVIED
jgi:peptidyl-prolyl cis-trans isomerase B (cyclophilin B)